MGRRDLLASSVALWRALIPRGRAAVPVFAAPRPALPAAGGPGRRGRGSRGGRCSGQAGHRGLLTWWLVGAAARSWSIIARGRRGYLLFFWGRRSGPGRAARAGQGPGPGLVGGGAPLWLRVVVPCGSGLAARSETVCGGPYTPGPRGRCLVLDWGGGCGLAGGQGGGAGSAARPLLLSFKSHH